MGQHIAVVGAGICGMCVALALAEQGNRVTVFERDIPPPDGDADKAFFEWKRRGAAQFRHPHAFLGLMCGILQDKYPDLVEEFWQAGARKISFVDMLPPKLLQQYSPHPVDERLWLLMCRRATMETVMRRYVERQPDIEILNSTIVTGLKVDSGNEIPIITGLKLSRRGENSEFDAEVVVDASGRTSKFKDWLAELGTVTQDEKEDSEIVYYTRHFKLLPGVTEPSRHGGERSAGDLGYMKFGVFPGEGGHFAVIICLPVGEQHLRQAVKSGDKFDAIARTIPGLNRWIAADVAVATTNSFGFADIHSAWMHFVDDRGQPVALNFFAVGDAAVRTNPLYGRGCSIGIKHAHLLSDLLGEIEDPKRRAIEFEARTELELRPFYKASLNEDRRGISRAKAIIEGENPNKSHSFRKWLSSSVGDAIGAAAREQIHVLRGAMQTFNLLEKPGEFLKDWRVRLTILRYMLRGRKRNAQVRLQPGPSRSEMLQLIKPDEGNASPCRA